MNVCTQIKMNGSGRWTRGRMDARESCGELKTRAPDVENRFRFNLHNGESSRQCLHNPLHRPCCLPDLSTIAEAKSLLMGSFGFDHRLTLPFYSLSFDLSSVSKLGWADSFFFRERGRCIEYLRLETIRGMDCVIYYDFFQLFKLLIERNKLISNEIIA